MRSHVAFLTLACALASLSGGCVSVSSESMQGVYSGIVTSDPSREWKVILAWDRRFLADLELRDAKSTKDRDGVWQLPVPEKHLEGSWSLSPGGDHLYLSRDEGGADVFIVKRRLGKIALDPEKSDLPTLVFQNELRL